MLPEVTQGNEKSPKAIALGAFLFLGCDGDRDEWWLKVGSSHRLGWFNQPLSTMNTPSSRRAGCKEATACARSPLS